MEQECSKKNTRIKPQIDKGILNFVLLIRETFDIHCRVICELSADIFKPYMIGGIQ